MRQRSALKQLKQAHAFSLRNGLDHTQILITKLLEIPDNAYAHQLFDLIPQPSTSLCNKLIQAYSSHGPQHQCFSLYYQMCQRKYCFPSPLTFTFLFSACSSLNSPQLGRMLHGKFVRSGFEFDVFALTALVDMYAKLGFVESARKQFDQMRYRDTPTWNAMIAGYSRCGSMEKARELFELMPLKNVVSWTTMISGYSQNGQYVNALNLFSSMEMEGFEPNEVTLASVLPACANLGALEIGERIEKYARRNGYISNVFVSNALLEMYAKCGKLDMSMELFNEISHCKNLCSWNSMIMSLAIHGRIEEALQLFDKMLQEEMAPDEVTFVAVLAACTHCGLVSEGQELFESMERDFSITPKLEHYGCMVDLLGRAGRLVEAYKLIQSMPMKPDSVIWGTLLGACSFHGNVDVGEKASEALSELEPWNPGNYVIMSNIYASSKRWDGVAKLRKKIKGNQMIKTAGFSYVEEGSQVHKFVVDDKSHPRSHEIHGVLEDVYVKMKRSVREDDLGSEFDSSCMIL